MERHTSTSASSSVGYSPTPPISVDGMASSSTFQGSFGTNDVLAEVNGHAGSDYGPSGRAGEFGHVANGHALGLKTGGLDERADHHSGVICDHLYQVGFQSGMWSDVEISVRNRSYKLHRIILARSPYLLQVMQLHAPGQRVWLNITDDNVTDAAIAIVLGHLYASYSYNLLNPANAPHVLAAATLFGCPDLARYAYDICRDSINADTIVSWVQWCEQRAPTGGGAGMEYDANGISPPSSVVNGVTGGGWGGIRPVARDDLVGTLRYEVHKYLTHRLIPDLQSSLPPSTSITSHPRLLSIFAYLPFELFKLLVEDGQLALGSDQDRFAFAKKAIASRKKLATATAAAAPGGQNGGSVLAGQPAMVENVVLRFTGKAGSNVHVTRNMRTRKMFKVDKD